VENQSKRSDGTLEGAFIVRVRLHLTALEQEVLWT